MDELELLRDSDDPVVQWMANHNNGYMIEEILEWASLYYEGQRKFWCSWRGFLYITFPSIFAYILLILLSFIGKFLS